MPNPVGNQNVFPMLSERLSQGKPRNRRTAKTLISAAETWTQSEAKETEQDIALCEMCHK
jgi:hypothetical protein